jgi:hypothetical protein
MVKDPGATVGGIAFHANAAIPIMEGMGAGFFLNLLNPGILPGRLIKMAVNDHVSLGAFLRRGGVHVFSRLNWF